MEMHMERRWAMHAVVEWSGSDIGGGHAEGDFSGDDTAIAFASGIELSRLCWLAESERYLTD
jgi:hypothetical protein